MGGFEFHTDEFGSKALGIKASYLLEIIPTLTKPALDKLLQRDKDKGGNLVLRKGGGKNRPCLLRYENLRPDYRKIIELIHPNPYTNLKSDEVMNLVKINTDARAFYSQFKKETGEYLSLDKQRILTNNASVLDAIIIYLRGMQTYRLSKGGKLKNIGEAAAKALSLIDKAKIQYKLPTHPRKLNDKIRLYIDKGYGALIDGYQNNQNSTKIEEAPGRFLCARMADNFRRVESLETLLIEYNIIAPINNWKTIKSVETLRRYLHRPDIKPTWEAYRRGELKAKERLSYQFKTKLPACRDVRYEIDWTKLDAFYQTTDGKIATTGYTVVIDVATEVILALHICDTEDSQTSFTALKKAFQTSGHKPDEIVFDNQGGHTKLRNTGLYDKLTKCAISAQPYNGKTKIIESFFNRFGNKFKRFWFFAGKNIQSKSPESKANIEYINANKANLPTLEQLKVIVQQLVDEWNNENHHKTNMPRMEMYLTSKNPNPKKIEIWDMIDIFWLDRPEPIMYNAYGLTFTEKKIKYTYSVYSENGLPNIDWHAKNIDKKFYIKYDPEDMTMIYLYDKDSSGNLRFVTEAKTKVEVARAKIEQTDFDKKYIADVLKLNKDARIERNRTTEELLFEQGMSAADYGMVSPKILGVNSSKKSRPKKQQTISLGQIMKSESLIVKTSHNNNEDFDPFKNM